MNYPLIVDEKLLGTYTSGGRLEYRIKPQPLRLEGIHLRVVGGVLGGAITAQSADRAFTTLKRAKVTINASTPEGTVKGSYWDVAGSALVEHSARNGMMTSTNRFAYARDLATGSGNWFDQDYWFPFRLPFAADPVGYRTALPMDQLNEDLLLTLDFDTVGNVATGATLTTSPSVYATFYYRDLLGEPAPFVLTEWKSEDFTWPGNGELSWNIPQSGRLMNLLMQSYTDAATRGIAQASNAETWTVIVGRQERRKQSVRSLFLENELAMPTNARHGSARYGATTSGGSPNGLISEGNLAADSTVMIDFVYDTPMAGAFSVGSAPNLDPVRLQGQLAQVRGSNVTTATVTRFTYQKLLGDPVKLIGGL